MKQADILLINPPDDFSRYPYLGLCQIAAVLRERGLSVALLDSAALQMQLHDIVNHIIQIKPKIIGISTMSMMLRFCYKLINEIKAQYPDGIIVVGGAHIDADTAILAKMGVKYGFRGECEYSFADFCTLVLKNEEPINLPGLIVNDGENIVAQPAAVIEDLDRLPMPAFDLLPVGKYYTPSSKMRAMSYITSRGCPYNCAYCSKLQQKKYRHISPEKIVDHLEYLNRSMGVKWIEFVDEIFTLNKEYIHELCNTMRARKLNISWGIGTRIDRIDEALLVAMKQAGLKKIGFGIEAGTERVRFSINKKITNDAVRKTLSLCNMHKIVTMGSFILGLPTETESEILETIAFARTLPLNYAYFHRLIPIPNSQIFAEMVANGELEADTWTRFMTGEISHPICKPDIINEDTMKLFYKKAWRSTYLNPRRIWQNRALLLGPIHLLKSFTGLLKLASPKRYIK